jgi:hypothetical protein
VRYLASFDAIVDMPMEVSIYDLEDGDYVLEFSQGPAFDPDTPEIAENAYLGYSFTNGLFHERSGADLQQRVEDEVVFQYRFGGAVPEPASWLMMVGGLGLAGAALRRRSLAVRRSMA